MTDYVFKLYCHFAGLLSVCRPQDGEIFGEFPPRQDLLDYTRFPAIVSTDAALHLCQVHVVQDDSFSLLERLQCKTVTSRHGVALLHDRFHQLLQVTTHRTPNLRSNPLLRAVQATFARSVKARRSQAIVGRWLIT